MSKLVQTLKDAGYGHRLFTEKRLARLVGGTAARRYGLVNRALKIHALLCRKYLKGRDWYDFSWYVARGVFPNLAHLRAALVQFGPWRGQAGLTLDTHWLSRELGNLIDSIDWDMAGTDVRRFLCPDELRSLDLWGIRFFSAKLAKLLVSSK